MQVLHVRREDGSRLVELLDEAGEPIVALSGFLRFLAARGYSSNTLVSCAYDLRHLWRFFADRGLSWDRFTPPDALALLEYLRAVPSRRPRQRMTLTVATLDFDGPGTKLAGTTVNRTWLGPERPFTDDLTGQPVRYLFMRHGQLLSTFYLFETPIQRACKQVGLVLPGGRAGAGRRHHHRPPVPAHRGNPARRARRQTAHDHEGPGPFECVDGARLRRLTVVDG